MKNALKKSAYREIRSTKSRFLSIFGIVAIGVGFFSGVKAAAPDMRLSADKYFDDKDLMDFRVVSTYAFDESDIVSLLKLPGVQVTPSYYTDVLSVMNDGSPLTSRVFSIGGTLSVNKLELLEGRMPEKSNECVAVGTGMKNNIPLGATVTFSGGDGGEPSDILSRYTYNVVGIILTPVYIDKSSFGSTNVGNGSIASVYYIPEENFCVEYNTEVYLRFPELASLPCYGDEYKEKAAQLKAGLEEIAEKRKKERFNKIIGDASAEIEKARQELADAQAEADSKLADGEKELADAKNKLDEAEKELEDGEKKAADGEKELADARNEIDSGYNELEEAKNEYNTQVADAEKKLSEAEEKLNDAEKELSDGEKEYAEGLALYIENLEKYNDGLKQYEDGLKQYEEGEKQYEDGKKQYEDGKKQLSDAKKQYRDGLEEFENGKKQYEDGLKQYEDGKRQLIDAETQYRAGCAQYEDGVRQLNAAKEEYLRGLSQYEDGLRQYEEGKRKYEEGQAQYDAGYAEYCENKKKLDEGKAEYETRREQFDQLKTAFEAAENELEKERQRLEELKNTAGEDSAEYQTALYRYELACRVFSSLKSRYEEAERELEDGRRQIEEGEAQLLAAQAELESARQALSDAREQLEDAEKTLAESKKQLDDGRKQIAENEKKLDSARNELDRAKAEIDKGWSQLNESKKQLDDAKKEIDDGQEELDRAKAEIDKGQAQLDESRQQLDDAKKELKEGKKTLDDTGKQLADAKIQLNDAKVQLDDARKELDSGAEQLADGKKEYENGVSGLNEKKEEAKEQFADAEQELSDAEKQYSDGRKELEEAKEKLETGRADYEQGMLDYADGEKEFYDKKAEAEEKLADAQRQIDEAQQKLDDLDEPIWYIFTREDNAGYAEYGENSDRINNIAAVFPVFFILVAILVCLTTMTRMVDEQRVQIGTLKALGYSDKDIIFKYMMYAMTATAAGAVFGVLVGMKLFPFVIITAYGMLYSIPVLLMPIDLLTALISIIVSLAAIAATVFFACRSALGEQTAQLMRPKPPKNGKRILLEYITPLWRLFNFSSKVTARNLFRYKRKMLMSIIGIAGCTALLLTGFALYDSINDVIYKQYDELQNYDGIAVYDGKKYPDAKELASGIVNEHGSCVNVYQKQMDINTGGKNVSAYIAVPKEPERFTDFLILRDRVSGEMYKLEDDTVYMDEKLSLLLHINAGDTFNIMQSDTKRVKVTLTAPFENYPGHYIYMTEKTYTRLFGETPEYNSLYFSHGLTIGDQDAIAQRLLDIDGVMAVSFMSDVKTTFSYMLNALNFVIIVIIGSAGTLAFIVMYNLTNININERIREIATLKVLGFYDTEVDTYIFRENILLTLLGTGAGLVLGVFLAKFVISTAEIDFVMFGRNIYFMSYVLAGVLTLAFSVLVTLVMHRKLTQVNMIEALKSVE